MIRRTIALVIPVVTLALLGFPELASAKKQLKADLEGFQEVPSISTPASGEFRGRISDDQTTLEYQLSYSNLQGTVRQAHIHFGQAGVNGGISVFLCQTATNPDPTGLAPYCPTSGSVTGTITAANIVGPMGQGIEAGELSELLQAILDGVAYVNVHSTSFPGGEIRGQIRR